MVDSRAVVLLRWVPLVAVVVALAIALASLAITLTWGGEEGLTIGEEIARSAYVRGSLLLSLTAGVAVFAVRRGPGTIALLVPWACALVAAVICLNVL